MAIKRLLEDRDNTSDKKGGKRMRSLPSFTMVIRKVVAENFIQHFCGALEPLLRRVVQEEVERGLIRRATLLQRQPQMLIEESKSSSSLQLIFKKPLFLPIFTENKIEDEDNFPLEIQLANSSKVTKSPSSIKVEIVVIDGEFPYNNSENWLSSDFNRYIVKERQGRRPLLIGDTIVTIKEGFACINELKFTDNSSWIRSRNFRLGVRVISENQKGLNIREAVTSPFMVKDHRGESYKKHYPPLLSDEVWRLEKIGKDGVFHKKLMVENVKSVQDFLKLLVVDFDRLRKVLGMSDKTIEATINHARTCLLSDKLYLYHAPHYTIVLNPICEVVSIEVNGVSLPFNEFNLPLRETMHQFILDAYNRWDSLEEINLPLQGQSMNQVDMEPHQIEGYFELGVMQNDDQMRVYNSTQVMQNTVL